MRIFEIQEEVALQQKDGVVILEVGDKIQVVEDYYDPRRGPGDTYYTNPLYSMKYTLGVKEFASEMRAYWLVDLIGIYYTKDIATRPFLIVTVDVTGNSAVITFKEDTYAPVIATKEIDYTDLPVSVRFYLIDGILLFPSEY